MLFGKDKSVAKIRTILGCTWADAEAVYDATIGTMKAALDSGEKVRVPGIGILRKVAMPARAAKNPATGAPVQVGPRAKYALASRPKAAAV